MKAPQLVPEHVGRTWKRRLSCERWHDGGRDPGVVDEGVEGNAVPWSESQAGEDEGPAGGGDVGREGGVGAADVLVRLEGDVATDHVVEEDSQGPHGRLFAQVAAEPHPLGRRVDPGALEL